MNDRKPMIWGTEAARLAEERGDLRDGDVRMHFLGGPMDVWRDGAWHPAQPHVDYLRPAYGTPLPWHRWFAWKPVHTSDRGWRWLLPIWRRRVVKHDYLPPGGSETWWQYAVERSDHPTGVDREPGRPGVGTEPGLYLP